jgi:hypothetical protein
MSTERQKILSFSESLKDSDLISTRRQSSTVSRVVMEYVDSILKDMPTSIDLNLVNEFFHKS